MCLTNHDGPHHDHDDDDGDYDDDDDEQICIISKALIHIWFVIDCWLNGWFDWFEDERTWFNWNPPAFDNDDDDDDGQTKRWQFYSFM